MATDANAPKPQLKKEPNVEQPGKQVKFEIYGEEMIEKMVKIIRID